MTPRNRPRSLVVALGWARAAHRGRFPGQAERWIEAIDLVLQNASDADERLVLVDGLAATLTRVVAAMPPDGPLVAPLLLKLATVHTERFAITDELDALESAVSAVQGAVAAVGATTPQGVELLDMAVFLLVDSNHYLNSVEVLTEALAAARASEELAGAESHTVATVLRLRFELEEDPDDLAEAERLLLALTARADLATSAVFSEYAHVLELQHQVTGNSDYVGRAVAAWRRAVSLTEAGDEWERPRRASLACALMDLRLADEQVDLDEILAGARLAVAPGDDEPEFGTYHSVATVLRACADVRPDDGLLAEAEVNARAAFAAADYASEQSQALDLLSSVLHSRFRTSGDLHPLDEAIKFGGIRIDEPPASAGDHAGRLGNLGISLLDRYLATGDRDDLDQAIELDRRAVAALPKGHHDLAKYENNLGVALCHRYRATGSVEDLDEAVSSDRKAVVTPSTGPDRAQRLSTLGTALFERYARFGRLSDLDEDVALLREALSELPAGHPDQYGLLSNLGTALRLRYERLDARADLDEAVAVLRNALDLHPRTTDLALVQDAYSSCLFAVSLVTGDRGLRDQAVNELVAVVAASPSDSPDSPRLLANLLSMVDATSGESVVREALSTADRVILGMPSDHPLLPGLHSNLSEALTTVDPARAAEEAEAAIRLAVDDHPDRAQYLVNLAAIMHRRFAVNSDDADLRQALDCLRDATGTSGASPAIRLQAASAWGRLAAEAGNLVTAAHATGLAVELLPEVTPHRLERTDSHRLLADLSGLASSAAAHCLSLGQVERAVALLELGRGVLLNRTLGIRDDIALLRDAHPDLANAFERARDQIDRLDLRAARVVEVESSPFGAAVRADAEEGVRRERRREVVTELDEVVERIRALPHFDGFLRPPSVAELLDAASEGPVVVVNVSEHRCDAVVLTASRPIHVPLRELRAHDVDHAAREFHRDVIRAGDFGIPQNERAAAEERVSGVLAWLWTAAAQPVLDAIGPTEVVWWVPTGALALLPLHAATAANGGDAVLDRVASSYTPTITALRHARRAKTATGRPLVIVSSYRDDRLGHLPYAVEEAQEVATASDIPVWDVATSERSELTMAVGEASNVHIALHAVSDAADPSRSGLRVGAYSLVVAEIAAIHAQHADLAYLSACETTLTTAALADEAIHLTSAFQLAGFRHVVGTLWAVPDAVASRACRYFYRALRDDGLTTVLAAHQSILRLRELYRDTPSTWAGYLHAGA